MTSEKKFLTISVLGLGYVGCVSAACLARDGHSVIGVDISEAKVNAITSGSSPIFESGLDDLVRRAVQNGKLRSTSDVAEAISASDMSLICVGTPSRTNGSLDLSYVERVCSQIGGALETRPAGHVVVVRSTMLPGSMSEIVRPALESASNKKDGQHFHTAINPEFLRESTAIDDYGNPPKIVIGTESPRAAELLRLIYAKLQAPLVVTSTQVAEMVKYTDNAWHAVKISFGNEVGEICHNLGIDSHEVADIFLTDTHLNISPAYLRPGFAFGGSCLPKDLRALTYLGRHRDLDLPMLQNVLPSNNARIEAVFERVLKTGAKNVGLYGLSFKPNTDDLRESPFVKLAERMIGKGIQIRIFDENIQLERLTGANKEYIQEHIPHLVSLLVDGFNAFDNFSDLVIIGHRSDEAAAWVAQREPKIRIIDLARISDIPGFSNYEGVSW